MRIVIDLQGAQTGSGFRGIGRYSLSLSLELVKLADQHEIYLFLNTSFPESIMKLKALFEGMLPSENIILFKPPYDCRESKYSNNARMKVAEYLREDVIARLNPDVLLVTSLFEGYNDDAVTSIGTLYPHIKTAVILYDLIPYINPKEYLRTASQKGYYYRKIESLKKADILLSISNASKEEAIKILSLDDTKIMNVSSALDPIFTTMKVSTQQKEEIRKKFNLKDNIILYVPGGFDARKNFKNLIRAYSLLPRRIKQESQLVIASKICEQNKKKLLTYALQSGLNENDIVMTDYLSDMELMALYHCAALFVFPSLHEGFGLPILEAMSCNLPVIGSNNTSIPEVINNQEALFDPHSILEMSKKMQLVLEDILLKERLRSHASQQIRQFSWKDTASKVLSALEALSTQKTSFPESLPDIQSVLEGLDIKFSYDDLAAMASALAFCKHAPLQRQFLIDISELVHRDAKSGIQRVVRSILKELLDNPVATYVTIPIYFDGMQYRYANNFIAQWKGGADEKLIDFPVTFSPKDIYFSLDLNAHLAQKTHQLHAYLSVIGVQMYFMVYDVLLLQHPEWWPQGTSQMFQEWFRSILQTANKLICISQSVADDVKQLMRLHSKNKLFPLVDFFHLGADIKNSLPSKGLPENAQEILNLLASKPTFLMVGTIEPRKGHHQTLLAFEKLWEKGFDIQLVIVGKKGWLVDELCTKILTHTQKNEKLFWLEAISDEYLEKIYEVSTCLIGASEGEGFGLPLIEAAQYHLPIIARDIPVFREVAKEYAFYFNDTRQEEVLEEAIADWLMRYKEGTYPKSDKMPYLRWNESVYQLIDKLELSYENL
ncbi:MAG: glycosyltransferase family 1 protein [Sulfurospirillaceae bacterium]|nr:glycosyltransferase family 1 protein [Sulfurospirillaceae bacterium]